MFVCVRGCGGATSCLLPAHLAQSKGSGLVCFRLEAFFRQVEHSYR